jgi:predicted acyltransferase
MFLMMAEVLRFAKIAAASPGNAWLAFLGFHQSHVEWTGCSLHDLIQPSFSFIVGVALPFSIAGRLARGASRRDLAWRAFGRALLLVALGVFLRSVNKTQTNFTFEDTLSQIGLGYGFLFLLGFRPVRDQWIAFASLLLLFWAAFALFPLPPADFDYARVKVPADWLTDHGLRGFAAHWQKNSNLSWAFDTWFLNLWPRPEPFVCNAGGYATLSFVPTLATMILGLITGETLRGGTSPREKVRWMLLAGGIALASGWLLGALGFCPVVKRIWTPAWTLFSGGWCLLGLAAFYEIIDRRGHRAWTFPLVVIGMNSIAAYCMDHLWLNFIRSSLKTHFGDRPFLLLGPAYESLLLGTGTLAVLWLILYAMHRQKLFLKI